MSNWRDTFEHTRRAGAHPPANLPAPLHIATELHRQGDIALRGVGDRLHYASSCQYRRRMPATHQFARQRHHGDAMRQRLERCVEPRPADRIKEDIGIADQSQNCAYGIPRTNRQNVQRRQPVLRELDG